jgi:hypothetical protein
MDYLTSSNLPFFFTLQRIFRVRILIESLTTFKTFHWNASNGSLYNFLGDSCEYNVASTNQFGFVHKPATYTEISMECWVERKRFIVSINYCQGCWQACRMQCNLQMIRQAQSHMLQSGKIGMSIILSSVEKLMVEHIECSKEHRY